VKPLSDSLQSFMTKQIYLSINACCPTFLRSLFLPCFRSLRECIILSFSNYLLIFSKIPLHLFASIQLKFTQIWLFYRLLLSLFNLRQLFSSYPQLITIHRELSELTATFSIIQLHLYPFFLK